MECITPNKKLEEEVHQLLLRYKGDVNAIKKNDSDSYGMLEKRGPHVYTLNLLECPLSAKNLENICTLIPSPTALQLGGCYTAKGELNPFLPNDACPDDLCLDAIAKKQLPLEQLTIVGHQKFSAKGLWNFNRSCSKIEHLFLRLVQTKNNDQITAAIRVLSTLKELIFPYGSSLTDIGVGYLADYCKNLTALDIAGNPLLNDNALERLGTLKLEKLDISGSEKVTNAGLQKLPATLKTLIANNIDCDVPITEVLQSLPCKDLEELSLTQSHFQECNPALIPDQPPQFVSYLVSDDLKILSEQFPKLTKLNIEGQYFVTSEAIQHLTACKNLKQVRVARTQIDDQAIKTLQNNRQDLTIEKTSQVLLMSDTYNTLATGQSTWNKKL